MDMLFWYCVLHAQTHKYFLYKISANLLQRGRLEEQVRQHNKKRAAAATVSEVSSAEAKKNDDNSYDVTLDDDFITALEYGMPPASGMVC